MPRSKEIEITQFSGLSNNNRKPQINEAQAFKNLDIRSKSGDMVARAGVELLYNFPSHARLTNVQNLEFSTFYVADWDQGRDITVVIQKATLNPEANSLATAINTLAIWAKPYFGKLASGTITSATNTTVTSNVTSTLDQYVGKHLIFFSNNIGSTDRISYQRKILSHTTGPNTVFTCEPFPLVPNVVIPAGVFDIMGWVDDWQWLNESVLTSVDAVATVINEITEEVLYKTIEVPISHSGAVENMYMGWHLFDITRSLNLGIIAANFDSVSTLVLRDVDSGILANDIILFTKNFLAEPWKLALMSLVKPEDISFHKVLNELRINFGPYENRIAASVGFLQKSLRIDDLLSGIDYLPNAKVLSNIFGLSLDPYNSTAPIDTYSVEMAADYAGVGLVTWPVKKYFYYIMVTLDGYNKFLVKEGSYVMTTANNYMDYTIRWLFGSINKRITNISLFLSENDSDATSAQNPYMLFVSYKIAGEFYDNTVGLSPYGYFIDENGYMTASAINVPYSVFQNSKIELSSDLGYTPTLQYASGWDQALVVDGKTVLLNPFIEKKIINKAFFSIISESLMHDVIPAQKYFDFESFDNNDVVGMAILNNGNYLVLKEHGFQIADSNYGNIIKTVAGKGCISRKSIVSLGDVWRP